MLIVLALITAAVTVFGCGWEGTSHSVRFNAYQGEREMGRLPPLPKKANGVNETSTSWTAEYDYDYSDYSESPDQSKKIDAVWERAALAEQDGNLELDRDVLTEYLKLGESAARRNSATDRLDALAELNHGATPYAVKAYLEARRIHDGVKPDAAEVDRLLEPIQSDRNLKDNVAYLRAAGEYQLKHFEEAAASFKDLSDRYPNSEKREAALFMTAVATMKTSINYIPESGESDYGQPGAITSPDQAWHEAYAAFQKVLDEYPKGKYFHDARGWQGYLELRRHDRAGALIQYYRLLAGDDDSARTKGAVSLAYVRWTATDDEISKVEKELADEPQAALAYAYHNIYNYAINPLSGGPPYETVTDSKGNWDTEASRIRNDELEKEWRKDKTRTRNEGLTRTLAFSKLLMTRYPNLSVGGSFALRAAQASEELGDNEAAITFAQRALRSGLDPEGRGEALWALGIAQHRSLRLADARSNLQTLVRNYPKSNLIEGARRRLAMIAEDSGDVGGALEQYVALDYGIDMAYLVDVLMTPEQLAAFIQKHPESPKKNEFTYALGLRYLRLNRWAEARQTFAQVKVKASPNGSAYSIGNNCYDDARPNCLDPKDGESGEDGSTIITPNLVMREIQTANDLEALERAAAQAQDSETSAETLYQLASYQFGASTLLFYNPIAWKQDNVINPRYWNLSDLAGSGKYRAPNEAQILFDHMQEHDTPARALKIYLDVATRFPQTRAAQDALYTAAVCHERLSNYNPYWRGIYENGLHAGTRMVTYNDVKAAYPNYLLPRGTYGWQPSTRTVNNGPGWAPPPPPPPRPKRLTKRERLKVFVNEVGARLTSFWNEKGKRWTTESLIVFVLVFTVRIARRNQRRLRARLARQRIQQARQMVTYPWFDWFWIDPIVPSRREQIRKLLGDKRQEFIDLARDHRSRPVLLRSIASHSMVTGLIASLIWTLWFG
jgi:TolA-binding protein